MSKPNFNTPAKRYATMSQILLLGFLLTITLALAGFLISYLHFGQAVHFSIVVMIVMMLIGSLIATSVSTHFFNGRVTKFEQELGQLNEKVHASTSALDNVHQGTLALIDKMPTGVLIFNRDMKLTNNNKQALLLLGLAEEDGGKTKDVMDKLNLLIANGENVDFNDWLNQARAKKVQDTKRWGFCTLRDKNIASAFDLFAHYSKNSTYGHELIVVLADRTADYDRQERQMEFISLAAHELRGPITILRGLIEVLHVELGETLSEDHNELIHRLGVSARQLSGYIDNILNASRVEQDTFQVHIGERDWQEVLKNSLSDLEVRAKAHHRSLKIKIEKDMPKVAIDTSAIYHVINNLVDNAIKYSHENGIVRVESRLHDGMVETLIQDAGIGIPANLVDNLFTKFYRSHRSKQTVGGTGLGLYLSKIIIEAHGGNIWVRSTEGAGTTFGFTLPIYASVAEKLKQSKNEDEEGIIRSGHGWIKNHSMYRR